VAKVDIRVPDIGDYHDVGVIDVMVKVGDAIAVDQALCTIETDKSAMDIPATVAGTITALKVAVGSKVNKGDVVCVVEAAASVAASAPAPQTAAAAVAAAPAPVAAVAKPAAATPVPAPRASQSAAPALPSINESTFGQAHAGPAVRKLARELGVDLGRVQGSGVKGRITEDDVKAFVKGVMAGGGPSTGVGALPQVPIVDFAKFGAVEVKPLNRIKKISGPRLQAAWVNVPHVTQHDDADITDLETMRKLLKADAEKVGAKLTPLAFLVKASVAALKEFPDFNASLDPSGQNLVYKKYFHIGFAADTPNGLVVPVIKDADQKSVFEIAKLLGEMSAKARDGKLPATDMQGGCFSISSLGGIGGTAFTPIVNAPEVAILGVSKSAIRPVWDGSQFKPRMMLPLSLSYDHRVIDGAAAARFTKFLGEVLAEVRGLVL
jgi:pyruvate dehydrogenase E2 component (dihydrolipoamide acetyltransferase)